MVDEDKLRGHSDYKKQAKHEQKHSNSEHKFGSDARNIPHAGPVKTSQMSNDKKDGKVCATKSPWLKGTPILQYPVHQPK